MACIIQKFGGTSVATLERIKNVANIIANFHQNKRSVIAVVSAMAGVTNKFIGYAHALNVCEGDPEYDYVVSSGELITAGLLAMALRNLGLRAKPYSAWQVPILTDDNYGRAVIQKIDTNNLQKDTAEGIIPVICGFQGINTENRVTTLGRGGSDLTAVAVASAVKADLCEIYSDVDGVYTVDPNLYNEARRIDEISYHEMLEMASQGAKILQEQSVDYAMKKEVVIRVASSFIDNKGTIISGKTPSEGFRGLAVTPSLSQIKIVCQNGPQFCVDLLNKYFIKAEILKNGDPFKFDVLLDKKKITVALRILRNCDSVESARQVISCKPSSRISVIGSSISTKTSNLLINALKTKRIEVSESSLTDHKINLVVLSDKLLESVALLHKHCGLGK
ncbi:MAG: aspartate kinase [Holosporaceae bacterium]|nr:aspartate kinase [Holosporaceae bacterium]